jgi:AcrR family transcriptional regulator
MAVLTRRERKEQTRALILRTAERLFARRGIAVSRTSDVAAAAGVSHGSVFVHFGTRDDLVEAVVRHVGGQIATRIRQETGQAGSVREVLAAHLEALRMHEAFYVRLVLEGPFLPRGARRMLVQIQSAISSELDRVLPSGRKGRTSPDLAFNTWIGLVHHYLANRDLFAPGGSVLERWGRKLLDYFVDLLEAR